MARKGSGGNNSSLKVSGRNGKPALEVHAHITGVEKTSAEFAAARRQFNAAMRDVIERAGNQQVLPAIRARFPSRRFASSLYVKRDRSGVFIGSRERGSLNRTVGWLDFGGRRPRDGIRRVGPQVIYTELHNRRQYIDDAILRGVLRTFDPLEHSP